MIALVVKAEKYSPDHDCSLDLDIISNWHISTVLNIPIDYTPFHIYYYLTNI
ncbi:hypothetical protein BN903_20 [Halorubrum sp. AJ67]|nr:hypothetical protein BN903_20 [Halorubrum sp. AJ67]